jgi:phosphoglycolate phosphatase/putative hydrolase of the HAD superfamily
MSVDLSRLKAIVFDVDGTLYRQSGLRRAMLFKLLREIAVRPFSGYTTFRALSAYRHAQELLRGTEVEGDIAAAQLRLASQRSGQAEPIVMKAVARWMEQEPLPLLERFVDPALRGFLIAARGKRLGLGILSDYPAASKLDAMGLTEFFDVVVAAQDAAVNRFKPHPSGLAEALRRLGAAPDECIYVGDRHEIDWAVAGALGVPCVIVGGGNKPKASLGSTPALTRVSDYHELHSLLFPPENERTP